MATSMNMSATSLLLTCFALLALGLFTTATLARPLPPPSAENSPNKLMMIITMIESSIQGKVNIPSPPSKQVTITSYPAPKPDTPSPQLQLQLQLASSTSSVCNSSIYMSTELGKIPKSPPSPKAAPVPIQQIRSPSYFQFIKPELEKTPKSPPTPKPAPSKHQGIIEQPIQQKSPPHFQIASF